jgi:hypothetical protein
MAGGLRAQSGHVLHGRCDRHSPFGERLWCVPTRLCGERIGRAIGTESLVFEEDDKEFVRRKMSLCLETPGRSNSWEVRKRRKDGKMLRIRENARAMWWSRNKLIMLIACQDIWERYWGALESARLRPPPELWFNAGNQRVLRPHYLCAILRRAPAIYLFRFRQFLQISTSAVRDYSVWNLERAVTMLGG